MKILLFGTMGDIGPSVLTSLEGHNLETRLVNFPQNVFRDEFGYRRELLRAVALDRPDVIVPIGHQLAMANIREDLHLPEKNGWWLRQLIPLEGIRILAAPSATIRLLDSKVRCSALASELGIPQPKIFASAEDAAASEELSQARLIFKRDRSFGGSGVYRPKTLQALENLITHEPDSPYLIEEFIEGEDVSVDCVRFSSAPVSADSTFPESSNSGTLFSAGCYRTVSKGQGQGPSVERIVTENPQIVGYASRILDRVDYNGVCGMDFRVDSSGQAYFLECNPRFCGGISTQIASGFDIPYLLLQGSLGI